MEGGKRKQRGRVREHTGDPSKTLSWGRQWGRPRREPRQESPGMIQKGEKRVVAARWLKEKS